MTRTFILLFVILSACLSVWAQVAPDSQTLVPGKPIEREIAGGESHMYQLTLQTGQFMRALVEQKGINLTLALVAPDGKQALELNFLGGGQESLSYEASAGGEYRLIVRAISSATPPGAYQVRTEIRETATEQDRQRVVAERLSYEAIQLIRSGVEAAQQSIGKSEQALVLWRQIGDQVWEAYTLRLIGTANRLLGRYGEAIQYYEQALPLARAAKDRYGEADALHNVSIPYGLMGRHEKSAEYSELALAIWRELKSKASEINALNNLSIGHTFMGRYDKAIVYSEQSLALLREVKNRTGMANTLNTLGSAYKHMGRYDKAVEYYEQSLALMREVKNQEYEAAVLGNIGMAYQAMGRPEKNINYQEQALAISRRVKDRAVEARTLNSLGDASRELSRFEKAIEYYEQALAIHREMKMRINEGIALGSLGTTYYSMGRPEKAIEYIQQGLAIVRETKSLDDQSIFLYIYAKAERDRGNLTRARTLIEESLKIGESMRSEIYNPLSRATYFASVQRNGEFYIDLLMRLHDAEPAQGLDAVAVEASERARARGLLELLTEAGANIREGVGASLIELERDLARKLNAKATAQVQLLSSAHTPEQAAELKQEISQLENDYERAQADIRKASPHYAALVQPQPLKLKEIQAQLDADTLLLEYALGEDRSYLWAISKDSLTSYQLPKGAQIKQSALQVYELLTARSTSKRGESIPQRQERIAHAEAKLPAAARELSQTLLAPVAAQLGSKRLVVVADGALQYVPFAMLPDPSVVSRRLSVAKNNGPRTTHHGQPLIVNHEVISLPSASALAIQRTELAGRQLAPKMLAVIADPVFDRTDERFKTLPPETSDKAQLQTISFNDSRSIEHLAEKSDDKSSVTTLRLVIPRLPFTGQEAHRLLALTPKNSSFGAIDFQANRANVLSGNLSQYRYVHFATHGLLDSERPGLSSLVLSMVDVKGKPQDGFLRANDIYNLKLPAELVVLSACQTGLGKEIKGEGLVGLTRGFMYAGAARVVVSLWNVNDRATADLMTKFYEKMLKQGERPAAALRTGQVEMWKQKKWQSPYYWAAFTMQGEWR
jgi:CHAT domain-containing protein